MANEDDKNGNGQLILDSRTKTKKPSMYKVIMLNDDYTPMEFVVHVLQKFFGRSADEATQIMLNVHQRGVGVCGVYSFEIAESKAQKTIDYARKNDHGSACGACHANNLASGTTRTWQQITQKPASQQNSTS